MAKFNVKILSEKLEKLGLSAEEIQSAMEASKTSDAKRMQAAVDKAVDKFIPVVLEILEQIQNDKEHGGLLRSGVNLNETATETLRRWFKKPLTKAPSKKDGVKFNGRICIAASGVYNRFHKVPKNKSESITWLIANIPGAEYISEQDAAKSTLPKIQPVVMANHMAEKTGRRLIKHD